MNVLTLAIMHIILFCNSMSVHAVCLMTNEHIHSTQDTLIVKGQRFNNEFLSDSSEQYYYYWVSEKNDTLDFKIRISESHYGGVSLSVAHDYPILFSDVLNKIKLFIPMLKNDYDLSKLQLLDFRKPIYYIDLAHELSNRYYKEFGNKRVENKKLIQFLLNANITSRINSLLEDINNKNVRAYGFEKFRILTKEYYKDYLPNIDFSAYPDFVLDGYTGFSVFLQ